MVQITIIICKSDSSGTAWRDVYTIRPTLIYASKSLLSGPDSICLPIYFFLPINDHYCQASQTVTLGLMFRVRCNFYLYIFFLLLQNASLVNINN